MQIDKKTCWYTDCTKELNAYHDEFLKPFDKNQLCKKTYHHFILNKLIKLTNGNKILDLGCGSGYLSKLFIPKFEYTGADLELMIEKSAKRNYPENTYINCDLMNDDLVWISNYDIIILSGVIDSMQYPLIILEKTLKNALKYIILHRQEITKNKTKSVINESYGGYTYHSIINRNQLLGMFDFYKFKIVKELTLNYNWNNGGNSFLLKKIC